MRANDDGQWQKPERLTCAMRAQQRFKGVTSGKCEQLLQKQYITHAFKR